MDQLPTFWLKHGLHSVSTEQYVLQKLKDIDHSGGFHQVVFFVQIFVPLKIDKFKIKTIVTEVLFGIFTKFRYRNNIYILAIHIHSYIEFVSWTHR